MKSLGQEIEDAINACGGVLDQQVLSAIESSVSGHASSGSGPALAEVPYVVGLLREVGLPVSAKDVLDRAILGATDPLDSARLQNLHGRLAFEERDYASAASSFEDAFIAAARVSRESAGFQSDRSGEAAQLQFSALLNLASMQRRQGQPVGARTQQRLAEYRIPFDPASSTASVGTISLHWLDATLTDLTPDLRTVDALRAAATAVLGQQGLHHADSSYALMTVAVAACEAAVSRGDLNEADELADLMDAMARKEAASPHSRRLREWMQLSALSGSAELAVARGDWVALQEVAGGLLSLADSWANRDDPLYQVVQINLATVNLELAREGIGAPELTRGQAVTEAMRALPRST